QYSLGIVVYEWLCGACPFEGTGPLALMMSHLTEPPPRLRERKPTITAPVEQVVFKALAKKPQERFATVAEFAQALEEAHRQSKQPQLRRPQFVSPSYEQALPA